MHEASGIEGTHPLSIALYLLAAGICRMRQSFSRRGARPCCSSGHVHVELLRTHKPFWEYTIKQFSHWMNWCFWWCCYVGRNIVHILQSTPCTPSLQTHLIQHSPCSTCWCFFLARSCSCTWLGTPSLATLPNPVLLLSSGVSFSISSVWRMGRDPHAQRRWIRFFEAMEIMCISSTDVQLKEAMEIL
jgi:hypothetical protein